MGGLKRHVTALGGPARVWKHPNHIGSVGLNAPYSKDFCTTCNQLRVSAKVAYTCVSLVTVDTIYVRYCKRILTGIAERNHLRVTGSQGRGHGLP